MTARHPNRRSCRWGVVGVETRWLESVRQYSVLAHLFRAVDLPHFLVVAGSLDRNRNGVEAPRETRTSVAPDCSLDDSFSREEYEENCCEPLGKKDGFCELREAYRQQTEAEHTYKLVLLAPTVACALGAV